MANNNRVNIPVDVNAQGSVQQTTDMLNRLRQSIQNVAREVTVLNQQLGSTSSAAQAAQRASVGVTGGGGSGGAGGGNGSGGGTAGGPGGPGGYGRQRGVAGVTGASARDFARQAEGLNGLVRVYATFAANVYALSTAFNALKGAADLTNMVKGLDQLGASSGRNLGALTKQLVSVSDGAIATRDALDAVAKGSAANLTNQQILRLTEVAKDASQALGRSMPDALDRLIRGVGKIEPELLDELGILVKVKDASEAYARTLGKTANSLTDFEKRQAFTNAVIEQGEKKFGDISLEANSYSKVLATTTNLLTSALQSLNTVIEPVIKFLGEHPSALAGIFALMGVTLIKQVIPAISLFRDQLQRTATQAAQRAQSVNSAFGIAQGERIAMLEEANNRELASTRRLLDQQQRLQQNYAVGSNRTRSVRDIARRDPRLVTSNDVLRVEREISRQEQLGETRRAAALRLLHARLQRSIELRQREMQLVFEQARLEAAAETTNRSLLSQEGQRQLINERAQVRASRARIVQQAYERTQVEGIGAAWRNMRTEVQNSTALQQSAFPRISRAITTVTSGLAIATAAATTFGTALMGALSTILPIIGLLTVAFQLLDDWLSTNSKSMEKFTTSLEGVETSVDSVGRALDFIAKQDLGQQMSVESIQSRANALSDLNDNLTGIIKTLNKVQKDSSGWDKIFDFGKSLFGNDVQSKANEAISKGIASALQASITGKVKDEFVAKLTNITGLAAGELTAKNIEAALDAMSDDEAKKSIISLTKETDKLSKSILNTASAATKVSEAFKDASNKAEDLVNNLSPSGPEAKFGMSLINSAIAVGAAINDGPRAALAGLNKIINDTNNLKILPPETISYLEENREQLEYINNAVNTATKNIETYNDALSETSKKLADVQAKSISGFAAAKGGVIDNTEVRALKDQQASYKESIDYATKQIDKAYANPLPGKILAKVLNDAFDNGSSHLEKAVNNSIAAAGLSIQKAAAAGLSGRGTSEVQASIRLKELSIQEASLKISESLLQSQFLATSAIDKNTIALDKHRLTLEKETAKTSDPSRIPKIDSQLQGLELSSERANKASNELAKLGNNYKAILKLSKEYATTDPIVSGKLAAFATNIAGIQNKGAELAAERIKIINEKNLSSLKEEFDYRVSINSMHLAAMETAKAELEARKQGDRISTEEYIAAKDQLDFATKTLSAYGEQLTKEKAIAEQLKISEILGLKIQGTRDLETFAAENILKTEKEKNAILQQNISLADQRKKQYQDQLFAEQSITDVSLGRITEEQASFDKYMRSYNELITLRDKAGNTEEAEKEFQQKSAILDLERERTKEAERLNRLAAEQADAIDDLNASLNTTVSMSQSLSAVFGKVGESVGAVTVALAENAKRQEEIEQNLSKKKLENLHRFGKDTNEQRKADKKADDRARKDSINAEFDMYSDMAKGAKGFFKEKTAAYKLFAGIEKAIHIARLVMDAKETAIQIASVAKTIAANTAKQASNIATSVTAFFASLGPFGWIGIAAMFATLAAFGISGKGGGGGYNGPTAEQLQETAGTGQKYVNGQKVDTGFGRLGESSEKSEAVAKSLDFIQKYTFENLEYSNKMLNALEAIRNNIGALTTSIVRVRGLTGGPEAEAQFASSGPSGISKIQTRITTGLLGKDFGGIIGSLTSALFGKVSTELKDSGIKILNQSVGTIIDQGLQAVQYQIVQTTKKKLFGLSKSTSTNEITSALDQDIKSDFGRIIKSLSESVIAAADALGMGGQAVVDKIRGVTIQMENISLKDLKASEIPAYIESIIGSIGSQITKQALGDLEKYQQAGEDLLQTALRVARTVQIFDLQFEQMGKTLSNLSVDAKLSLIDMVGGLEEFTSKANFFTENFLTEAEKLAPIQKKVTEELGRMGFSAIDTVEEFKNLVLTFGTVGGITEETYAALMNVSKAFYEVYGSAADVEAKLKEIAKTRRDLEFEIAKKLASAEGALALTRKRALDELDASLRPLQQYLYALEDEATAKDNLIKAYQNNRDEIQQTITKLSASSKALRDFNKSLLLSKESPLTPQQKYAEARSQFNALLAIAKGPASTKEEIALRDDALNKLQASASGFLELSAMLNASSTKYTDDFNAVRAALESTASSLDSQQTEAQKQLDVANKQLDLLGVVNTSVLSVKDALSAYSTAIINSMIAVSSISSGQDLEFWRQKTNENLGILNQLGQNTAPLLPGLASGGIGRGLTVVGERGPEIVNFDSPGMVFNNSQSQGMMSSFVAPLVNEVQQLRKQVQLLQEQAEQNTRAMINANIISNQQNAETISNSIADAEEKKSWDSRSKLVEPK